MYAETYKVRAWLEEPARWLQWAFGSLQANPRKLGDAAWNLQQFWKALANAKTQASTPQDWGDLLTLDAQSQLALGWLQQARQLEAVGRFGAYMQSQRLGAKAVLLPVLGIGAAVLGRNSDRMANWLVNQTNPFARSIGQEVERLGKEAARAFQASQQLATEAKAAYRQAGVAEHQAGNTSHVAGSNRSQAADTNEALRRLRDRERDAISPGDAFLQSVKDTLTFNLLGLPLWGWGLAAAGLLVLLPPPAPVSVALRGR